MTLSPRVITIILNTNRREDTLACLQSLQQSTYPNSEIIVLDNASTDGSVEAIKAQYPNVQIVNLEANLGYAGNNNVGIRLAIEQSADWVFVLNEDTVVEPTCIENLIRATYKNENIGVIGPMIYTFDDPPLISSAGGVIDWLHADGTNAGMGESDRGQFQARMVDFLNGCGMLVSKSAIEKAGLLDESFFIYYEETDWCTRIKKAGFDLWFEPSAKMKHKAPIHHSNFGPSTLYYMTRNRIRFFARHTPWNHKVQTLLSAMNGIVRGIFLHRREGRYEHARATQWAVIHALQCHWGKANSSLWQSSSMDRTLGNN